MHLLSELFSVPPETLSDIHPAGLDHRASLARLTVIEARVLAGDLFYHALRQAMPDLEVELKARLDDVRQAPGVLLYSFVNRGCDAPAIDKALGRFTERFPDHPLVIVTDTTAEEIEAVMKKYAVAYWIPASAGFDALVMAVRNAARGRRGTNDHAHAIPVDVMARLPIKDVRPPLGLTVKEYEIVRFLHDGKSNKVIAHALKCSESTVKVHIANMMRKLRLHNRTQLALVYQADTRLSGRTATV